LQPQRMPAQIHAFFAALRFRNAKAVAEASEQIPRVERPRKFFSELEFSRAQAISI